MIEYAKRPTSPDLDKWGVTIVSDYALASSSRSHTHTSPQGSHNRTRSTPPMASDTNAQAQHEPW